MVVVTDTTNTRLFLSINLSGEVIVSNKSRISSTGMVCHPFASLFLFISIFYHMFLYILHVQ